MRLFSYIVMHDSGFSPNPFWGYCTLADCKPVIRRTAVAGDWIVGLSPKARGYRIVYAMKVQEILEYEEYFSDPRFAARIPDRTRSEVIYKCGDNIYQPLTNGTFRQLPSQHSHKDGTVNPTTMASDLSGRNALVSQLFYYFGASGPELPENLHDLITGRGHKSRFTPDVIARFIEFIKDYPEGVNAAPALWPSTDTSWRTVPE
jgi:hypothetical protein